MQTIFGRRGPCDWMSGKSTSKRSFLKTNYRRLEDLTSTVVSATTSGAPGPLQNLQVAFPQESVEVSSLLEPPDAAISVTDLLNQTDERAVVSLPPNREKEATETLSPDEYKEDAAFHETTEAPLSAGRTDYPAFLLLSPVKTPPSAPAPKPQKKKRTSPRFGSQAIAMHPVIALPDSQMGKTGEAQAVLHTPIAPPVLNPSPAVLAPSNTVTERAAALFGPPPDVETEIPSFERYLNGSRFSASEEGLTSKPLEANSPDRNPIADPVMKQDDGVYAGARRLSDAASVTTLSFEIPSAIAVNVHEAVGLGSFGRYSKSRSIRGAARAAYGNGVINDTKSRGDTTCCLIVVHIVRHENGSWRLV